VSAIAHVGHWSITLIYLAPFVAVAAWIARDSLRRRREAGARGSGEDR
jgi:hypothetical protein